MLYTGMIEAFIIVFILSAVGSLVLNMVFRFFGKKGYLGNLYPNVRGGIPRAIGLVPFIILDKNLQVRDGKLGDIAATILDIMELEIPKEMTGKSLIERK